METAQDAIARILKSTSDDAKEIVKQVLEIEKAKLYIGSLPKAEMERTVATAIKGYVK